MDNFFLFFGIFMIGVGLGGALCAVTDNILMQRQKREDVRLEKELEDRNWRSKVESEIRLIKEKLDRM